jgi:SAM-dependent methyltransferase
VTDLAAEEYIRQRLRPVPGDDFYLHLSDLRIALEQLLPRKMHRVLDFGCGGSPYRSLFEPCIYHRADLAGTAEGLDFTFGLDSAVGAETSHYDCVLSSQVLEHVVSPSAYLSECHRVLENGAHLLLTTHGLFEEHACPYDYWRWTCFGLRKIVESAGFEVRSIKKLTTGPRAVMFFTDRQKYQLRFQKAGLYGGALNLGLGLVRRTGARRKHTACDQSFPKHRVVDDSEPGHEIYVAIALVAQKA